MGKGKQAELGSENVAANGYHYVKTSTGWRLKHHLVAEQVLGRPLEKSERVTFKDNDRSNFNPSNIIVNVKRSMSNHAYGKKLYAVEERMRELVEDAPDKHQALSDLKDALSDVRLENGFAKLS